MLDDSVSLLDKKLILFGGKGGVGKQLMHLQPLYI